MNPRLVFFLIPRLAPLDLSLDLDFTDSSPGRYSDIEFLTGLKFLGRPDTRPPLAQVQQVCNRCAPLDKKITNPKRSGTSFDG